MRASIIIPVYNERKNISNCLKSLLNQSYQDFEIIIIDDGSTDNTLAKVKKIKSSKVAKIISQEHQGPALARNRGAVASHSEILIFVDADMEFDKDFLLNLIKPIIEGKSKGTFSKDEYVKNWNNVWARCWVYNASISENRMIPKNAPNQSPVFRAILKKEFNKVQGFNARGYDDDWTLSEKLGYKATLAKNATYFHYNPKSLVEVFKKAKWMATRKHKFGILGKFYRLLKFTLPFSLAEGLNKAHKYGEPKFILFKLFFDCGFSLGLIKSIFTKSFAK
jgi:glycosyltransferase involved in cell wall biosynthesis